MLAYEIIPQAEMNATISWRTESVLNGRTQIADSGDVAIKCKVFLNTLPTDMVQKQGNVVTSLDSYVILIPKSADYTLPIDRKVGYTIKAGGTAYMSVRIHDIFGHYTIDCVVVA